MDLLTTINFILYLLTLSLFIWHSKKKGMSIMRIGTVVLGLYTLISFIAMLLYVHPMSYFKDLELFPFIYLFSCFILVVYPILLFDERRMRNFRIPSKALMNSLSLLAVIIALLSSVRSLHSLPKLLDLFSDLSVLNDEYLESRENTGSGSGNIFVTLNYLFSYLYLLFLFFYLSLEKKSKLDIFFIISLAISLLLSTINNLINGLRGPIMFVIFDMFFFYILFFQRFNEHTKKIARRTAVFFLTVITAGLIMITIGRFGEGSYNSNNDIDITYGLEYYAGQSPLYFNNYGLNAGGIRDGDKTFPLIRKLMGLNYSKHWMDRRYNYSFLKIDDSVFATFIGDFTIDYGPIVAFIFFVILCLFNNVILLSKTKGIHMGQIIVLYIIFIVCTHGFALYPFAELGGNRTLAFMLFLAIIFSLDARKNKMSC